MQIIYPKSIYYVLKLYYVGDVWQFKITYFVEKKVHIYDLFKPI